MVDRVGAKIAVSEQLARNSKLTYGAVLEQVSNLDDNGELMAAGAKGLPTGELDRDGPPTCLGTTGRDRLGFLQANLIRDTSYFLHGTQLGNRQIFQVQPADLILQIVDLRVPMCIFCILLKSAEDVR